MATDELHLKYAPVMRFAAGECFFPMPIDDFISYSALYAKGQAAPLIPKGQVTIDDLLRQPNSQETFLRSVDTGPTNGIEVASRWGVSAILLIYKTAQGPALIWTEELARSAYDWFSHKTKAATQLFWWNKLLLPKADADRKSGTQEKLPRFDLPQNVRQSGVENYRASQGANTNYTYYYRTVQVGSYMDLQYWFFYGFNDWAGGFGGFNDHEGDWEGFHVFFKLDASNRPIEPPAYVCYLGHESRMTKPWDHPDVEKVDGTHPVIYAGAGSHASYPQPKQYPLMALYGLVDYATGGGSTLSHNEWRSRINLETVPWLAYMGSWGSRYWLSLEWMQKMLKLNVLFIPGEVNIPGVSAPRDPKFNDGGDERETWKNPVAFAGIA